MRQFLWWGCFVFACSNCLAAESSQRPERAFWVIGRDRQLDDGERAELKKQGIFTLYWYSAELETANGPWRFRKWPSSPQKADIDLRIVPVVRITTKDRDPLAAEYRDMLVDRIGEVVRRAGASEVQIDWTPPERLLGEYASVLQAVREKVGRLSITARPEWLRNPAFPQLDAATDEIIPRFFEETEFLPPSQPLLDLAAYRKDIEAWKNSGTRWRIGLPSFTRITVYDVAGKPRTDLHGWTWDDICFEEKLQPADSAKPGLAIFNVLGAKTITTTAVEQDEALAVRTPAKEVLEEAERTAGVGVVFYRMANGRQDTVWSTPYVGSLNSEEKESPKLVLRAGAGLSIFNDSKADLLPNLSGTAASRGYALQIDAPKPVFQEVREGDFTRLVAEGDPDTSRRDRRESEGAGPARQLIPTSVEIATRLTFWFSSLPSGATLQARTFRLGSGTNASELRYRFINVPGQTEWMPMKGMASGPHEP